MAQTQNTVVPIHLGLILDGNRRWARANGVPLIEGHRRGYQNLKTILKATSKRKIKYVSAYVFSTENWSRSTDEVKQLMRLLLWILKHETQEINREGFRIRVIGSKLRVGKSIIKAIHEAEELTKNNKRGTLLLCLDYGGHQEIVEAVKKIVKSGVRPETINAELISSNLYAPDVPPVDLIIRTSGEQRLSNFMLWESAYSELLFVKGYWPDFSENDLDDALEYYRSTKRRFGK